MKKVKILVSFEYECEVESENEKEAFDKATDSAMDYLGLTLQDSQKFDEFWEYQVHIEKVI